VYRVALATSALNARRAAVAATLFTWRQQQDSVHFINPYYGSMLARNTVEFDAADAGNQQYNFLPYAIVRCRCSFLGLRAAALLGWCGRCVAASPGLEPAVVHMSSCVRLE